MEIGTCKSAIKTKQKLFGSTGSWIEKSFFSCFFFFLKTKSKVSTQLLKPPPTLHPPSLVQAVETRCVTFQRRSGSAPDVGLFNNPPSCGRGKDAAGTEGDGKHKANLQDLNCGFRFLP